MESADELSSTEGVYVLAKPRETYAMYIPQGGTAKLDLVAGRYRVSWFDPAEGGEMQRGSVELIAGPGVQSVGNAPSKREQDWVAVVQRVGQ